MPKIEKLLLVVFFAVFLAPTNTFGQHSPGKDFIITSQGHAGYIMVHRKKIANLIKGHVWGAEVNYTFQTNGCKLWHQEYKYPEVGFCFVHLDLANPEQLGTMEALYPFTDIRLNKLSRKTGLYLRLATGLTYFTKPFDRITNHKNEVIGSHFNAFVNIRLSTTTILSDRWRIYSGIGLSHASNGSYTSPNLGINIPTINLGVGYYFGNPNCEYLKDTTKLSHQKWQLTTIGVFGIKELEKPGGEKFLAYSLQGNLLRGVNYKNSLGGGVEVFYNNATKERWAQDSVYTASFGDIVQAGIKVCYAYNFHKLSFPVEFGYYVYKKESSNGRLFHRIGFRYMITQNLVANFTLLTHFAKAEYFEWGLGYRFNTKQI